MRLTGDGAVVLSHDDRLDRTTDGRGQISRLSLAAVRRCDAGAWFGAAFRGETVPTLDEALELCGELGLGANIEIKAEDGLAGATAASVAACVQHLPFRLPLLISSFLPDAVGEAAQRAPQIPRAMLWRKLPRDWARVAEQFGCATVNADQAYLRQPPRCGSETPQPAIRASPIPSTTPCGRGNCSTGGSLPFSPTHPI